MGGGGGGGGGGWGRGVKAAGADCLEIWEPLTPGTLRVCTGIAVPCEIAKGPACRVE